MLDENKSSHRNRKRCCVIILGPYRSGTSLISRMLVELGFYPGEKNELYIATDWNPAGYIQRPDITKFNTEIILNAGGSLEKPPPPSIILKNCTPEKFQHLNLKWMLKKNKIIVKDPRFCFTLYTWINQGVLKDFEVKIIRIHRDLKMAAKSSMQHYDVKHYVGSSLASATKVLESYNKAAEWHCKNMKLPFLNIGFEELVLQTNESVLKVSNFLQIADNEIINRACALVNSGKTRIPNYE